MTITKAELAGRLHEEIGLNKREANDFVEDFFEVIKERLEKGEKVKLSRFGQFNVRHKTARPGRNPKTGDSVAISERRVVTFKQSQSLKEDLEKRTKELQQKLEIDDE